MDHQGERVVRVIDSETYVEIHADDGDEAVQVKLGPDRSGLTLVGDLPQLHRVIVEADRLVSALTVRSNNT